MSKTSQILKTFQIQVKLKSFMNSEKSGQNQKLSKSKTSVQIKELKTHEK